MPKKLPDPVNGATKREKVCGCTVRAQLGFQCHYNRNGWIVIKQEDVVKEDNQVILSRREAALLFQTLQALIPDARD